MVAASLFMSERHCWYCSHPLPSRNFFCDSCGVVLPLNQTDAFVIFSLAPRFVIDEAALERQYHHFASLFHPDRYVRQSDAVRLVAEQNAATVNDAYEAIKNPLRRAILLLSREGMEISLEEEQTIDDPQLLMAAMEDREQLEAASDAQSIGALHDKNEKKITQEMKQFSGWHEKKELNHAKESLLRLRYGLRLRDAIEEKRRAM